MTPVEERIDPEQLRLLKEKYRDDGLERLARSNPDYYNSHGSYLPELATLLLAERAEMRVLLTEHSALRRELEMEKLRNGAALLREALKDAHTIAERREIIATLAATESAQPEEELSVLGCCPHGVDLDREFCPEGCRV